MSQSLLSETGSSVAESEESGRKRKKKSDSHLDTVLVAAAESIGKLSNSVMDSQKKDKIDEMDGDWLFLKAMYVELKEVPAGRERDLCKMRIHTAVMTAKYGVQHTESTSASAVHMTRLPQQVPVRPIYLYKRPNLAPPGTSTVVDATAYEAM